MPSHDIGSSAAAFRHRSVAFFAAHDITPIRRVHTDNGSCYRSRAWAAAPVATGTKHKRTRPYTPRTNGKVERCNGTLAREWAYVRAYTSERERGAALASGSGYFDGRPGRPDAQVNGARPRPGPRTPFHPFEPLVHQHVTNPRHEWVTAPRNPVPRSVYAR
ncbi:hypothetical protein GCM10023220_39360 [Streptomyces ziwulingensis]|uniref:Integrase catalytic domain-containing protein n=1 Tax=Streptomyces ziwulingensis TaxID=1045501 RepID=A0ABP9CBM1_9ACTN